MVYIDIEHIEGYVSEAEIIEQLCILLEKLPITNKVLILPPDSTRWHSKAGFITEQLYRNLQRKISAIMPALGTHEAMGEDSLKAMFGDIPGDLFKVHDWRNDVTTLGYIPGEEVKNLTGGMVAYDFPAQANKILCEGDFDVIFSIGQVVPHEIAGMANYNKNILVGIGGNEAINKSHYISGVYGIENVLGRADNPVRNVFDVCSDRFLKKFPIIYILTVVAPDENGVSRVKGLYAGDDRECYRKAAALSARLNIFLEDRPAQKVVTWLDPKKYKSCWLANKAIYRTRMLIADGGELLIMAPGLKEFGEDPDNDRLIRKHGYCGTAKAMELAAGDPEMADNLGVITHLIYGSSDGRFDITYAIDNNNMSKRELEEVGYRAAGYEETISIYDPARLKPGWNDINGEEIYYIADPALGLWSEKKRFT